MKKNHFLILKIFKNTESAQLCGGGGFIPPSTPYLLLLKCQRDCFQRWRKCEFDQPILNVYEYVSIFAYKDF